MKKYQQLTIFGDSLVLCQKLNLRKRWPEILKKKIKKKNSNFKMKVNALNGITTQNALNKIDFTIKKRSVVLFLFGANDSTYYKSFRGKPRVSLKSFRKNYTSIIKKANKIHKNKLFIINGHKFLRKRQEGNKKTHNVSYLKYKKDIYKIAKNTNSEIIDTYSNLLEINPKSYCLPLPDGLHQNDFGSKRYSQIVYNQINEFFI